MDFRNQIIGDFGESQQTDSKIQYLALEFGQKPSFSSSDIIIISYKQPKNDMILMKIFDSTGL